MLPSGGNLAKKLSGATVTWSLACWETSFLHVFFETRLEKRVPILRSKNDCRVAALAGEKLWE